MILSAQKTQTRLQSWLDQLQAARANTVRRMEDALADTAVRGRVERATQRVAADASVAAVLGHSTRRLHHITRLGCGIHMVAFHLPHHTSALVNTALLSTSALFGGVRCYNIYFKCMVHHDFYL